MISSYTEFLVNPSSEPRPYSMIVDETIFQEYKPEKIEKKDVIKALKNRIEALQADTVFEQIVIKSSLIFWRIFAAISATVACIAAYSTVNNQNRLLPLGVVCSLSITYAVHFLHTDYKARKINTAFDCYLHNSSQLLLGFKDEAKPEVEITEDQASKKFKAKVILTVPVSKEVSDRYLTNENVHTPIIVSCACFSRLPLRERVSLWGYYPQIKWVS